MTSNINASNFKTPEKPTRVAINEPPSVVKRVNDIGPARLGTLVPRKLTFSPVPSWVKPPYLDLNTPSIEESD